MIGRLLLVGLIVLCLPSVGFAESPEKLGTGLTVTDGIFSPHPVVPAKVKIMTEEEFRVWAIDRNRQAYLDAFEKSEFSDPIIGTTTIGSGQRVSRTNNHGGSTCSTLFGFVPLPAGSTIPESVVVRESEDYSTRTFQQVWPGAAAFGGGPVVLINPFCFDYWKQRAE